MGKENKIKEFFVDQDIFGHAITVHYRGRDSFKTCLGSLCTLATYVLMAVNLMTLWVAFLDGTRQEEKTQTTTLDRFSDDPRKFSEHNMTLSLYQDFDLTPDLGRF